MGEMQAGPGRGASARFSRWVSVSTIGFGAVATAIGLMLLLQPSGSASIGWFAYQPLSDTIFLPPGVLLTPQNHTGTVLLIVGLHRSHSVPAGRSANARLEACGHHPIRAVRTLESRPRFTRKSNAHRDSDLKRINLRAVSSPNQLSY
jgi:hypothetical protein